MGSVFMIKLFHRNPLYKFIVGLVITATVQFFVPLLNAAVSDRCCESQQMQCCQEEFPSRMVCCISEADEPLDDSAPTQGLTPKTQKTPEGISSLSAIALNWSVPFREILEYFPTLKFISTDNQLYKRFSTFLIWSTPSRDRCALSQNTFYSCCKQFVLNQDFVYFKWTNCFKYYPKKKGVVCSNS